MNTGWPDVHNPFDLTVIVHCSPCHYSIQENGLWAVFSYMTFVHSMYGVPFKLTACATQVEYVLPSVLAELLPVLRLYMYLSLIHI